jgi:carboxymethylenebutenolidase
MEAKTAPQRMKASDFPKEVLDLFDGYVHGRIDRRAFLDGASRFSVAGMSASAMLEALKPNYDWAQQVPKDDPRIQQEYVFYESPQGHGRMRGYMAQPTGSAAPWPAVLVIHENRGLNPYIEDVVRRMAAAGFLGFGPDALTPLGGYPGTDEQGVTMQRTLDAAKIREDFVAAANFLLTHPQSTGRVGAVGFCFGGGMVNTLAWRVPQLAAGVPFYGAAAPVEEVPKINAPLLLHFAENDMGINGRWPAYEEALKANNKRYEAHTYPGTSHGFHNDTTPRYNEAAAKLAQERTIAFFNQHLRTGA